ncbi:MAG: hypothetical protein K8R67_14060 [Desulfobacteraceae bacterium]|nr:hypothetical protein [Desulfobacteraceae bacterium]
MVVAFLKKFPPSISIPTFYGLFAIALIVRFLFKSVYGAVFLMLGLYIYVATCTSISPFTFSELVLWAIELPSEYKVVLISSFVTVVGFVVAFHTATINWRSQMQTQLKVQAATEIESFFAVVSNNITTISLFIESLVEILNKIQNGASTADAKFSIKYNQGKIKEYKASKDILSHASIEVHRLIARNHNLLSTGGDTLTNTKLAAECLSKITKAMWLHIPVIDLDDPDSIQSFIDQVNLTEYNEFLELCDANYGKIAGLSGGIQGYLTAPVWGLSLTMFVNLIRNRKEFIKAIKGFRKDLNNDS